MQTHEIPRPMNPLAKMKPPPPHLTVTPRPSIIRIENLLPSFITAIHVTVDNPRSSHKDSKTANEIYDITWQTLISFPLGTQNLEDGNHDILARLGETIVSVSPPPTGEGEILRVRVKTKSCQWPDDKIIIISEYKREKMEEDDKREKEFIGVVVEWDEDRCRLDLLVEDDGKRNSQVVSEKKKKRNKGYVDVVRVQFGEIIVAEIER